MIVEHWRTVPLGDVLVERNERRGDRDLPVLSVTKNKGIMLASERFGRQMHGRDLTNYRIAPRDSIVLDPMLLWSGTIGRQKAVDEGVVSPDYRVYDVRGDVEVPFLEHAVQGAQLLTQFQLAARGTNVRRNRIARSDFLTLRLDLPPATEQRKIAAILSAVDEAIEKTQAMIDQVQIVKKALMTELLTRGLPGRHKRFKKTELGEIPEDWEVARCGELFEVQLGKMISEKARQGKNPRPYLRNQNVYWDRLDLLDVVEMDFDAREATKFRLRPGDLLACEGRFVGRSAIWRGEIEDCYYQKALHRLRAKDDRITTEFMVFFMMLTFRYSTRYVEQLRHASTIPHLPREKLIEIPVPVPPREEQDALVESLRDVTRYEKAATSKVAGLRHLKHALASVLLTGELRVTPDPVP